LRRNADGTVTETEKTTTADGSVTETEKTTTADGTVTENIEKQLKKADNTKAKVKVVKKK
jgi:hypothetical protein